jgi:hypothetical protein
MYKIDLLKGQGVPVRSRPEGIAITAVGIIVPILAGLVLFGIYFYGRVIISVRDGEIQNYQNKIAGKAEVIGAQKLIEQEKASINKSLGEVSSNLDKHKQTTPILVEIVSSMPNSMVLDRLSMEQKLVKVKVAGKPKDDKKNKDDKKAKVETVKSIPARTLEIVLTGNSKSDCEAAVKDFSHKLRYSKLFGDKIEDIKITQEMGSLDGQDAVSYIINCVFKPGL